MAASFSTSWLAGEARATALLSDAFRDGERRAEAARRAAERSRQTEVLKVSRALAGAIHDWEAEADLPSSAARQTHLDALAEPGTVAVVTGQQVGLFLGPLYSFYKAATAVAAARSLSTEAGVRAVPVFWLQTEDHDFDEIDHCHVRCPGEGPSRLRLQVRAADTGEAAARASVAERRFGDELPAALDALDGALGALPHAAEFLSLVRAHYRPGSSPVIAFAGLMAALFADEGLILLDPRREAVARLAAPVYRRALVEAEAIGAVLGTRGEALRAAGFDEQVRVRPGSPPLFFHEHDARGPRRRIARAGAGWRVDHSGDLISDGELLAILERDPLRLSSSALLRPIVQDALLPTAAYVGGPGEINYYAQLPPLHAHYGLPPPTVVPRARFRLAPPRCRALLDRLGLSPADAERPRDELLSRLQGALPEGCPPPDSLAATLRRDLDTRLDELEARLGPLDHNLHNLLDPIRRTRKTVERATERLAGRYRRSLAERDRVTGERVDRLRDWLFPEGIPQERYDGVPGFACQHGWRELKQAVLAALSPFAGEVRDIDL